MPRNIRKGFGHLCASDCDSENELLDIPIDNVIKTVYIFVPFEYKETAKKGGARWDANKKKWYTTSDKTDMIELYDRDNWQYNYCGYELVGGNSWKRARAIRKQNISRY